MVKSNNILHSVSNTAHLFPESLLFKVDALLLCQVKLDLNTEVYLIEIKLLKFISTQFRFENILKTIPQIPADTLTVNLIPNLRDIHLD